MSQDALFISAIALVFVFMASLAVFSRIQVNRDLKKQRETRDQ